MITIIRVLNLNRQTTAILENAYNIGYEKEVNSIWSASFSLPLNDPKVEKVESLQYVEITDDLTDEYIGLFRIMPKLTRINSESNYVTFECEHVLSTLLDACLFKYHQLTNYRTREVIEYLLDQQEVKHWELGRCDFERRFHYSWENENGIVAPLFSVPKPFDEPYMWQFDTTSYPWQLDLVKPDNTPTCRIKEGYNLRSLEVEENPYNKINRIYPLGAGEGVNQLTIESVNNGKAYLEDRKPGEEIVKYIWSDQRYTVAESLKSDAQALLNKWKEPIVTWDVSAAEVSSITGLSIDQFKCGNVVRMQIDGFPSTDLRIMKESKSDIIGNPGDIQLEIGNVVEDLGTTETDIKRRQKINELYSQGATNMLGFTYQDNCDGEIPAIIPFYVDDDVVNVNTVELTFDTKNYRAYSEVTKDAGQVIKTITTKGGGATVKSGTSGAGGGTVKASTTGGGGEVIQSKTTETAGQSTQTSAAGGDHNHLIWSTTGINAGGPPENWQYFDAINGIGEPYVLPLPSSASALRTYSSSGNHTHAVTTPAHSHGLTINIPAHSHPFEFTLDHHTHAFSFNLEPHVHDLELQIEGHIHEVNHKIVELDRLPSKVIIKVDGNTVPYTALNGDRINLVDYMSKDSSGKIIRGKHVVEILPDDLGRIEANLILRVFIQSQLGGNF